MQNQRKPKIAITGMGVVSPLGIGIHGFSSGLWECRNTLRKLDLFETGIDSTPIVAQIDALPTLKKIPGYRYSRTDTLAIIAAEEALNRSCVNTKLFSDAGVIIASTVAGLTEIKPGLAKDPKQYYRQTGFAKLSTYQKGHLANVVSAKLGLKGPSLGISVACASGAMAIALGARMIQNGMVQRMLVGGSDALCQFTISGFNALQIFDFEPCRPFDIVRKGLNIGEGAAILVLENLESALSRKAPILGFLSGWGMTNDAYHATAPHKDGVGLAQSIELALCSAKISADDIDYVNAHGTGTDLNDIAEVNAYKKVFGSRKTCIPVSSTKSFFGHNLGAAGAIEAVVSLLCLHAGLIPPTLRLNTPINCDIVYWIKEKTLKKPVQRVLSVSAGFGGSNTSLIFERWNGETE
ncbi:MAG: hypothetical protein A2161_07430 [Candidatus Schekmanbacteria bacterium RBG_13_48_7]|uniref:Nodulation protein E n=1 Tax=Candidatus Schekmanbacteria bacterium RBG_13_48_7 TaxID=1817878 RepID=A0A1F7RT50_9BACT|nr:MAG: hypothetical protein A2161_07430 [Candidatus Schekmanbacteria bacterium RBG_13_48_7]